MTQKQNLKILITTFLNNCNNLTLTINFEHYIVDIDIEDFNVANSIRTIDSVYPSKFCNFYYSEQIVIELVQRLSKKQKLMNSVIDILEKYLLQKN